MVGVILVGGLVGQDRQYKCEKGSREEQSSEESRSLHELGGIKDCVLKCGQE